MATTTDASRTDGPGQRARRRRRAWRWPVRLVTAAVLSAGAVYGFLGLTGAQVSLPGWATREAVVRLNADLGSSGRISVGRAAVGVGKETWLPRLWLVDVGLFDRRGSEVARLNEVATRFSGRRLASGEVKLRAVTFSGAQITLRRLADGTFDVSLGGGLRASGSLAGVLDAMDAAFAAAPLDGLERVEADQLTITLEDSRSGRIWQVTDGRVMLENGAEGLDMTLSADVFNGTEDLATTVIGMKTRRDTAQATLTATFENAAAADIAAQTPSLAFLRVLDAPIDGAISTSIGNDGRIERVAGTLEIGAGALQPTPGASPIRVDRARAYVTYDPAARRLDFTEISVVTAAASATARGRAHLSGFDRGWPSTLIGQLSFSDAVAEPERFFAEPAVFDAGNVDFRLRLDPFTLEIGQLALRADDRRFHADGRVSADRSGWQVALDLDLDSIPLERLLALWPVEAIPGTRRWIEGNVRAGAISNLAGAYRQTQGDPPVLSLSYAFDGAELDYLKGFPPIRGAAGYATLHGKSYTTVIEAGEIAAPSGGVVDIAGSVFRVPDVTRKPGRAEISVALDGPVPAVLSLIDLPPFEFLAKAGRTPAIADGRAVLTADLGFDLKRRITPPDVTFRVAGTLRNAVSDTLIDGRTVTAERLRVEVTPDLLRLRGAGRFDGLPVDVDWRQPLGPEATGDSRLEGTAELSQRFLDAFGIALPPGTVTGAGLAQIAVDLPRGGPPRFSLLSDLNRVALALPAIGWSLPAAATGRLEIAGQLGPAPAIERLSLDAAGLQAEGRVALAEGGRFVAARFDRVRTGGWLDAPVTLTGRGPGLPPAISVAGGRLDLREARFGAGGGGAAGPVELRLDRLTVSEGIALTGFTGSFTAGPSLDGSFEARVNGAVSITGRVVPTANGTAIRLTGADAGGVLAAAGILRNTRGGALDVTLVPAGAEGVYDGRLKIENTRIVEAPALTELLSAISIVGLIDQVNSGGITLSEIEADFRLSPVALTLYRSSAVGPSLGVSLDGVYDLEAGRIDMQGVLSPVYFLNAMGQLVSPRRGEGLFGFNFTLTGRGDNPRVTVNPLSIMTPGMFREIFRRAPPQRQGEAGQ